MDQYNALTRELFFANNNVKRFKTLVSMSRVKVEPRCRSNRASK